MIDKFSETWGEKALDPKNFLEVGQELKNLKKKIKEVVENSGMEEGKFNFYMQKSISDFSNLSGRQHLKDRVDDIVFRDPLKLFEILDESLSEENQLIVEFAKFLKNRISDFAIITDALRGGAYKSVEEQIKDFKFITRTWNKHF
jgi:hypothetical protein